jgi:hypothetical protein
MYLLLTLPHPIMATRITFCSSLEKLSIELNKLAAPANDVFCKKSDLVME